jgi:hypothetical protein
MTSFSKLDLWLIERIRKSYKKVWKLRKMCTIDEMMICYKETDCSLR